MRKIVIFIATLFSFVACDLNKLDPAQTNAFIKYFGDEGNTTGVDLLKLDDGYLLLANNNNIAGTKPITVLVKVDLNGNQLWSNNFPNIEGSALARSATGYYIVGDSIDITDPLNTSMSLIKTNLEGTKSGETYLGEPNIAYHGTGVIVSGTSEIVVSGYTKTGGANPVYNIFRYGYLEDLSPSWTLQKYIGGGTTNSLLTSGSIIESNGELFSTYMQNINGNNELRVLAAYRDTNANNDNQEFLPSVSVSNMLGGFSQTSSTSTPGSVYVQTITNPSRIAIATYNFGDHKSSDPAIIEESGKTLFAHDVIIDGNDAVILASTNKHADGSSRSDLDFYITKVSSTNGLVSPTSGFTTLTGGTGNETGAAIIKADDGGYVFLGTMENTNEVKLMVLGKVNNKGELIN